MEPYSVPCLVLIDYLGVGANQNLDSYNFPVKGSRKLPTV